MDDDAVSMDQIYQVAEAGRAAHGLGVVLVAHETTRKGNTITEMTYVPLRALPPFDGLEFLVSFQREMNKAVHDCNAGDGVALIAQYTTHEDDTRSLELSFEYFNPDDDFLTLDLDPVVRDQILRLRQDGHAVGAVALFLSDSAHPMHCAVRTATLHEDIAAGLALFATQHTPPLDLGFIATAVAEETAAIATAITELDPTEGIAVLVIDADLREHTVDLTMLTLPHDTDPT